MSLPTASELLSSKEMIMVISNILAESLRVNIYGTNNTLRLSSVKYFINYC